MTDVSDLRRNNRILLRAEITALTRERDAQAERIRSLQAHIVLVQDQNDELREERDALADRLTHVHDTIIETEVENNTLRTKLYALAAEFPLDEDWGDHPLFPHADWLHTVEAGNTRLGYFDWVKDQIEDLRA